MTNATKSRIGAVVALFVMGLFAASTIMAVWSGEWRWLLLTAVCYFLLRGAIR